MYQLTEIGTETNTTGSGYKFINVSGPTMDIEDLRAYARARGGELLEGERIIEILWAKHAHEVWERV